MKVLMLAQSIDTNHGPDGFVADWVRTLAAQVDNLIVLTYAFNSKEKLPNNTKVYIINGTNLFSRIINLIDKTFSITRKEKPNILFAHILEVFGITSGIVGKITGIKSVFWFCNPYDVSRNYLAKIAFFLNDMIITCGERLKERYVSLIGNWAKDKIISVGHGINLSHYSPGKTLLWPNSKKGKITILYAGRISPIKDISTLEKAVKKLQDHGKKITLNINGSYSYSQIPEIFKQTHIFVNSSKGYSLDKTLLEALACGVCAIGSDNTYPFMKNDFPELIFRAGNSIDLAYKISWLIDNPKKAKEITSNAQKFIFKNFNLDILMANIANYFRAITTKPKG